MSVEALPSLSPCYFLSQLKSNITWTCIQSIKLQERYHVIKCFLLFFLFPCSRTLCRQVYPLSPFYLHAVFRLSNRPPASTYFHLPIDEEEDEDIEHYERKYLTWVAEPSGSIRNTEAHSSSSRKNQDKNGKGAAIVRAVLAHDDLYDILGVSKQTKLDKMTLRRAYLSRSRACHPEYVLNWFQIGCSNVKKKKLNNLQQIPR